MKVLKSYRSMVVEEVDVFKKEWWYANEKDVPGNFDIEVACFRTSGLFMYPCPCNEYEGPTCGSGWIFYRATKEWKEKKYSNELMEYLLS